MLILTDRGIEIDDNGYIEKYELESELVHLHSKISFEAIELNNNIYSLYDKIKSPREDNLANFYLGTLERMHKDYQAILILLFRGMQSQARSIMRNLLEKILIMKAVDNDHKNFESWVRTQNRERNRTIQIVKDGYTHHTENEISKMNLEMSDDTEYVKYVEWAERADMVFDYKVIYHILCGDTHHTMSGIGKDTFEEEGMVAGFSIAPVFEDIDIIISLAMHYLLMTVLIINKYLGIDVGWTATLEKKLDDFGIEVMAEMAKESGRVF